MFGKFNAEVEMMKETVVRDMTIERDIIKKDIAHARVLCDNFLKDLHECGGIMEQCEALRELAYSLSSQREKLEQDMTIFSTYEMCLNMMCEGIAETKQIRDGILNKKGE